MHHLFVTVIQLRFAFLVDDNNDNENNYLNTDANEGPQRCKLVYNNRQHIIMCNFTNIKNLLLQYVTTHAKSC